MKATRLIPAVLAAALATGSAGVVAAQGFPTQGSQVLTAADAPRDASTGLPSGKRQH